MEERFRAQSQSPHLVHGNLLGSNVERGPSRTAVVCGYRDTCGDSAAVSNFPIFQCRNYIVSTANSYETHRTSFLWTTTVSTGFIEDVARPEERVDHLTLLGDKLGDCSRMYAM
jgi:hypothetical protein